jgi:hypothetical protein
MKNNELIEAILKLVTEERRIGVEILELLFEIERRKAYSDFGYDGLFSFCIKKLRYSEAQASRRIQAMRAVKEHPEIKEKIRAGKLTITTVAQVQTHFKKQERAGESVSLEEKRELFESIQNHSAKEVETKLQILTGQEEWVTLVFKLTPEMKEQWDQVKNLSAHSTHGQEIEILNLLMKSWLKKNDPSEFPTSESSIKSTIAEKSKATPTVVFSGARELVEAVIAEKPAGSCSKNPRVIDPEKSSTYVNGEAMHQEMENAPPLDLPFKLANPSKGQNQSRFIKVSVKRAVWARDGGQCKKCGSRFAVQFDHRVPHALGGASSVDNLRLLCRSCNQSEGISQFGTKVMKRDGEERPQKKGTFLRDV